MTVSTSDEVTALLGRCRKGNEIIGELWRRACLVADDSAAWSAAMHQYYRATVKLSHLCLRLQALGYTRCLYDTPRCRGTNELTCFGCPSEIAYWREDAQQGRIL